MRGGERTAHFSSLPLGQGWEGLAEIDWGGGGAARRKAEERLNLNTAGTDTLEGLSQQTKFLLSVLGQADSDMDLE